MPQQEQAVSARSVGLPAGVRAAFAANTSPSVARRGESGVFIIPYHSRVVAEQSMQQEQ